MGNKSAGKIEFMIINTIAKGSVELTGFSFR